MRKTFLTDVDSAIAKHGDRLRSLIGRTLDAGWIVWNKADDCWFPDEPVVLDFQGRIAEIVFWQLTELSLTWNTIDLRQRPNWMGCWDASDLEWRRNAHPALEFVVSRTLSGISLVEMLNETGIVQKEWLLHALQFHFGPATLTVFNALDENGLCNDVLTHPRYRARTLAGEPSRREERQ